MVQILEKALSTNANLSLTITYLLQIAQQVIIFPIINTIGVNNTCRVVIHSLSIAAT